jgi:hypothetical protein
LIGLDTFFARIVLVDPRTKIAWLKLGKGEQQIGQIAFGIDDDRGNAVDRGLLQHRDAQARLPAPGHADADGVRDQVLGVVEDQLIGRRLGGKIVSPPQVENAELLKILHRGRIVTNARSPAREVAGDRGG